MPPKRPSFKKPSLKRPAFDQPINLKRRNVNATLPETPNLAPANTPFGTPANPANSSNSAEVSGNLTADNQISWMNVVPDSNIASWTHDRVLRERNKKIRQIFQEEGLEYGKDVPAAELNSRISSAVKLRQNSVAKMFKVLYASRDVQLCFLLDVTNSMCDHINAVRDYIFKIVQKLTVAGHSAIAKKVLLAFVGYRDFGVVKQFELLPFTESPEILRQFCSEVETMRNDDEPEDVFGGLEKAIFDLNWSDSMCTKIIFHIADAPCHGTKYHSSGCYTYDRYPYGDPYGRTAENLFNSLREKGIQYHFGRINKYTDKMIEMFSVALGSEIEVFDIKEVEKLVDSVVSSVSVGMSINPAMGAKQYFIKTDKAIPNWSELPIFKGAFVSYEIPESVIEVSSDVPMMQKRPTKATIQIAEKPFAHGAERKVFYGRDLSSNTPVDIVLKEYIRNKTHTASQSAAVPYEIATQMQTNAAYLASIFNSCFEKKIGITHDIKFLKVQVLSFEIKPGKNRFMSCERRYGSASKFLRFSNNADYEMLESTCKVNNLSFDVVEQLMAFSHWTYQISCGYLMVVDLQGIKSTDESGRTTLELTDPAIHCKDLTRFGRTNMGEDGMKTFFGRHICNKFCQAMELKHPSL